MRCSRIRQEFGGTTSRDNRILANPATSGVRPMRLRTLLQPVGSQVGNDPPISRPIVGGEWSQLGITGNQASGELVVGVAVDWHQTGALWVPSDVVTDGLNRFFLAFLILQNVIVGLPLQLHLESLQHVIESVAKVTHCKTLITALKQPHPKHVDVVRHQTVHRASDGVSKGGVR
ncbi:hypothetical protein-transmembrane prediction [Rhodopirellula baltica SH 1]|uniref:Uncharacterized protein n=1 Tax=Rhodopirellula baltica (strain DSM 10527 / NCIMB 13988 / SH1) TaxID=243090 RepID=Q7UDV9_RHOBA|nr:hypothetical protein-transmembrane prediction [Rhodopirellula baltica SH 1]